jgi:pilus assembly protein Flp/PilA
LDAWERCIDFAKTAVEYANSKRLPLVKTYIKEQTMTYFKNTLSNLLRDESGQDLIEYALVAALIALGATAAMTTLAGSISTAFSTVGSKLNTAV